MPKKCSPKCFQDPPGSAGKSAEKLPKKCAPRLFLAFRERFRQFFGTFPALPTRSPKELRGALFRHFRPELVGAPLAGRRNLNHIRPPPTPMSGRKAFFSGGGVGVYMLGPTRQEFYTPPPLYTPPTPRRVLSWVGGSV